MKPKIRYFFVIFISLFLLQCSPTLNYLGKSYQPTENVQLYFDSKEIEQEYTTMGLLNFQLASFLVNQDNNYLNNLIMDKAKKVGADAVLVTRFSNQVHQQLDENINTKQVTTKETETVNVEAKFLKFK